MVMMVNFMLHIYYLFFFFLSLLSSRDEVVTQILSELHPASNKVSDQVTGYCISSEDKSESQGLCFLEGERNRRQAGRRALSLCLRSPAWIFLINTTSQQPPGMFTRNTAQ